MRRVTDPYVFHRMEDSTFDRRVCDAMGPYDVPSMDHRTTTTTTTIQKMIAETCERARWGFWEDRTRHREDSARGTREDVALGNGDDDSNGTMGASGGGVLENGRHHTGDGMTYGDFFAPPPSYADSVVYTRPETYSRVWGVLRYG